MHRDYLAEWPAGLQSQHAQRLLEPVEVEIEHWGNFGARREYARVRVAASPAATFSVTFQLGDERLEELQQGARLDALVFGILDVVITARRYPVLGMTIGILSAEVHPVESSPAIAFRMAGRKIGKRILEHDQQSRSLLIATGRADQ